MCSINCCDLTCFELILLSFVGLHVVFLSELRERLKGEVKNEEDESTGNTDQAGKDIKKSGRTRGRRRLSVQGRSNPEIC